LPATNHKIIEKVKGKGHPITCHKGTKGG